VAHPVRVAEDLILVYLEWIFLTGVRFVSGHAVGCPEISGPRLSSLE
jgi:hypothetical protein